MTSTQSITSLPLPPGKLGFAIIGETISFLRDPDFADKRQKQYGSIFKTHLFGRPTVIMMGAEANRFLFANENKYFIVAWPLSTRILLGQGSLSMQLGDIHKSRRKILSQAFQPRALAGYATTMEDFTHRYLHKWEQKSTLIWYPELRKYTFDIACKLLIGKQQATDTNLEVLFEDWCNGLFTIPLRLPGTKFNQACKSHQLLLTEIETLIRQRQQQPQSGEDALGLLLQAQDEDGNQLGIEELKDQILTLLFAGHETLTSAIASFCLEVGQRPDIIAKIRAEQQQFDPTQPITFEDLKSMTYLEQVMKEVLRFVPPVGGGFREVIQDCEYNGYFIPKDWSILYQIAKTHQDETVYFQPQEFDPERFSETRNEDKPKPFSWVPFGGGMRECIGKEFAKLEIKLFAALLVRNYDWQLLPNQSLDLITIPTPRPRDGLKVQLRRLND
ncbi:cytochrome P450 [Planktothrix agardhii]|jgi:cytochrome P450|uniref:cytochrome P450 n=1 Tax=Planktothrix agardhii TaxID=1160 RepID=UPI001D0B7B0E|nr:cytochrome P450 [Planktothrix agardhii]MCB8752465.1 cytochrome P450 [Planktothrix agardhii 1810]